MYHIFNSENSQIKVMVEKMEWHWSIIRKTSAVIILDRYAERGRYLIIVYSSN